VWPTSSKLTLRAVAELSCAPDGRAAGSAVEVQWTVRYLNGSCIGGAVEGAEVRGQTLTLGAGTLAPGQWHDIEARLALRAPSGEAIELVEAAVARAAIFARLPPLDAAPADGAWLRTISDADDLILRLRVSAPAASTASLCAGDAGATSIAWTCVDAASGNLAVSRSSSTGEALNVSNFTSPDGLEVAVPAALAPPLGEYVCTATVLRPSDGAVEAVPLQVLIVGEDAPVIALDIVSGAVEVGGRVGEADRLAIDGTVIPAGGTQGGRRGRSLLHAAQGKQAAGGRLLLEGTTLAWSAKLVTPPRTDMHGSGRPEICAGALEVPPSVDELLLPSYRLSAVGSPALALRPCALAGGAVYSFRLDATTAYGAFAAAAVNVRVNRPPFGGRASFAEAGPLISSASVPVELRQEGWADDGDDLPLRYAFGVRASSTVQGLLEARVQALSGPGLLPWLRVRPLVPGLVRPVGDATDVWGASSRAQGEPTIVYSGDARETLSLAEEVLRGLPLLLAADVPAARALMVLVSGLVNRADNASAPVEGFAADGTLLNATIADPTAPSCDDPDAAQACALREALAEGILASVLSAGDDLDAESALVGAQSLADVAAQPQQLTAKAASAISQAAVALARAAETLVAADGSTGAPVQALADTVSLLVDYASLTPSQGGGTDGEDDGKSMIAMAQRRLAEAAETSSATARSAAVAVTRSVGTALLRGRIPGEEPAQIAAANVGLSAARAAPASSLELPLALAPARAGRADSWPLGGREANLTAHVAASALVGDRFGASAVAVAWRLLPEDPAASSGDGETLSAALDLTLRAPSDRSLALTVSNAEDGAEPVASLSLPIPLGLGAEDVLCSFWDEAAGAWSTAGVATASVTPGAAVCETRHLTAFAARRRLAPAPPPLAPPGSDIEPPPSPPLVRVNDVSADVVAETVEAGPALTIPWILVLVVNLIWISGFAVIYVRSRFKSPEQQYRESKSFHSHRIMVRSSMTPSQRFARQQWQWIRTQHKMLRAFFHVERLHDENKLALDPYQKVAVITLIICFKLLATALLYRSGSVPGAGVTEPSTSRQTLSLFVTALVAALLVLPASFLLDRLFLNAQFVTLCRPKQEKDINAEQLFAAAAFEAILDTVTARQAIIRWAAAAEAVRVSAWVGERRRALLLKDARGRTSSPPPSGRASPARMRRITHSGWLPPLRLQASFASSRSSASVPRGPATSAGSKSGRWSLDAPSRSSASVPQGPATSCGARSGRWSFGAPPTGPARFGLKLPVGTRAARVSDVDADVSEDPTQGEQGSPSVSSRAPGALRSAWPETGPTAPAPPERQESGEDMFGARARVKPPTPTRARARVDRVAPVNIQGTGRDPPPSPAGPSPPASPGGSGAPLAPPPRESGEQKRSSDGGGVDDGGTRAGGSARATAAPPADAAATVQELGAAPRLGIVQTAHRASSRASSGSPRARAPAVAPDSVPDPLREVPATTAATQADAPTGVRAASHAPATAAPAAESARYRTDSSPGSTPVTSARRRVPAETPGGPGAARISPAPSEGEGATANPPVPVGDTPGERPLPVHAQSSLSGRGSRGRMLSREFSGALSFRRNRPGIWPDHADPAAPIAVHGVALRPELLFKTWRGRSHAQRASLAEGLARWGRAAGVLVAGAGDDVTSLDERTTAPRPSWLPPSPQGAAAGGRGLSAGDLDAESVSDDGDVSSGASFGRAEAPFEWLVLLALHRKLRRTFGSAASTVSDSVARVESYVVGQKHVFATPVGARAQRYAPSVGVRVFWMIFPWCVAAGALVATQLYTLTILSEYLDPQQLTLEWLYAAAWSVVQGWLVDPLIILMRNNLTIFAKHRAKKTYQFLEQLGCGSLMRFVRGVGALLD